MQIKILENGVLEGVPSASGIVKYQNHYYLIGDDSPFLFKLNLDLKHVSKDTVFSINELKDNRIRKAIKPDFETLELIEDKEIIIFGSGSKSPQRDIFIQILLEKNTPKIKTFNITSFYTHLKKLAVLKNTELNIEATAYYNGILYLFNRANNVVFGFKYKDLIRFFNTNLEFPKPEIVRFNLPKINGITSGFSGATALKDKPLLFFTSSVEDTNNAYDDGEILGSFVGIIDLKNGKLSKENRSVLIPYSTKPYKVESVVIDATFNTNEAIALFVTDSDGGESEMIKCKLNW